MPDKTLRWGILGVAKINDRLLPGFRDATNAELMAIASRSADRARAAAKAAGIPVAHESYDALLADSRIDAVYIPLPNTLHNEWTRKAADAGKHVLCEKPLTPTAAEARALVDYCRAKGVELLDGFMWPHHVRTAKLRQLIDTGVIGPLRHVAATFTFKLDLDPKNIRLQSGLGGGSLLDVGCYPVYGIRWAFATEPTRVFATAEKRFGVDVALSGVLQFSDGRSATFDCGFKSPLRQWLEVTGDKGVIRVPEMWIPAGEAYYIVECDGKKPERVVVKGRDQIVCMIEGFGRAVLSGREPVPSADESVKTLRVLDALAQSVRENRPIDL